MRDFLFVILSIALLTGCATTSVSQCQKAQLGFIQSSAALQTPKGGTESDYWAAYKTGAKESVLRDCVE